MMDKTKPSPNKTMPKNMKKISAGMANTSAPKGMKPNFGTNGSSRAKSV